MFGKTLTAGINGINTTMIEVEADVSQGLPGFEITGNMSAVGREARERVRIALKNVGIKLPPSKITINLSPANVYKSGTHYDLAIVVAILEAIGVLQREQTENYLFAGEVSLDGGINPIRGALPLTIEAKNGGVNNIILPAANAKEGAVVGGINVIGVSNLQECMELLLGRRNITPTIADCDTGEAEYDDFVDIKGQRNLKRAMLVAAAGMHNMLIYGPPGAGKSMAARRMAGIMPVMTKEESLEVSKLYSISGLLNSELAYISNRPFRSPHASISKAAFCGGGNPPVPGEISLAQSGILFMDEFNLFSNDVIESLRVPLETGVARIQRSNGSYEYGANCLLVAAMNPCKCGFYPDMNKCSCSEADIKRHLGKISRPILERIDIFVNAERISYSESQYSDDEYNTENMRRMVEAAIQIQKTRFAGTDIRYNSGIPDKKMDEMCVMDNDARELIKQVYDKYSISLRTYFKILKVARTIADLDNNEKISFANICEAVSYKNMEVFNA